MAIADDDFTKRQAIVQSVVLSCGKNGNWGTGDSENLLLQEDYKNTKREFFSVEKNPRFHDIRTVVPICAKLLLLWLLLPNLILSNQAFPNGTFSKLTPCEAAFQKRVAL